MYIPIIQEPVGMSTFYSAHLRFPIVRQSQPGSSSSIPRGLLGVPHWWLPIVVQSHPGSSSSMWCMGITAIIRLISIAIIRYTSLCVCVHTTTCWGVCLDPTHRGTPQRAHTEGQCSDRHGAHTEGQCSHGAHS